MPYTDKGGSRSVSCLAVYRFVLPALTKVGSWPMLGTAAWRALAADDPARWASLLDGGQHWALHLELNQEALAEASKDVAAAADWPAVALEVRQLADARKSGVRIERRPA